MDKTCRSSGMLNLGSMQDLSLISCLLTRTSTVLEEQSKEVPPLASLASTYLIVNASSILCKSMLSVIGMILNG